jgi:hypothetical protein
MDSAWIRDFEETARQWFDDLDGYLVVAAVNEFLSRREIVATLANDAANTPGIAVRLVVTAHNLTSDGKGGLSMTTPSFPIEVLSSTDIPRGPWPRAIVIVQGTERMTLGTQFVTRDGDPVNLSTMGTLLASLGKTDGQRRYLRARLRKLGFEVVWS